MTVKYIKIETEDFARFLQWYSIDLILWREKCYLCNAPLSVGDYLDGLFPYTFNTTAASLATAWNKSRTKGS